MCQHRFGRFSCWARFRDPEIPGATLPWARASSLHRHLECPAASHLPQLDRGKWSPGYLATELGDPAPGLVVAALAGPVEPGEHDWTGTWGTMIHDVKAGGPDPLGWGGPHLEKLWPTRLGQHEVSVAYDCRTRTVELLEDRLTEDERTAWKMSRDPNTITGTADWWGALPSGEPWVDDLKTGWKRPDPLTPQLLFYLLTRMLVEPGAPESGWVSVTHWPRDKEPTIPDRQGLWRRVSMVTLRAFQEEIDVAWKRATGANPAPRPGAHCLYCPSATVCDRANDY